MEDYYVSQVGTGLTPFEGMRFQRGHGLFSNFIKGKILPMLKSVLPYLGRTAMSAGVDLARNIGEGENFKSAAKKVLKKKAFDIADDALLMVKKKTGMGLGLSQRRKARKKKSAITYLKCLKLAKAIKAKSRRKKRTAKKSKRKTRRSRKPTTLF